MKNVLSSDHPSENLRPAGPKFDTLGVVCSTVLGFFVFIIIGLIIADVIYLFSQGMALGDIAKLFVQEKVVHGMELSAASSLITLALVIVTAIPVGYALSRFRFPGYILVNTLVDAPIVLPPVVVGVSLLAFFSFGPGEGIRNLLKAMNISLVSGLGIVLCQYLVSISYCIRTVKAAFDAVSSEHENVALTLGCTRWQAFWKVTLPLARPGVVAGCIMAWARAVGVFGPLMVFVGTGPRVLVMPTALWLELSVGNIETAIAIALIMLLMAGTALAAVHLLVPEGGAV